MMIQKLFVVIGFALFTSAVASADDAIFADGAAQAQVPTVSSNLVAVTSQIEGLSDSPTIQQRPGDVLAAAEEKLERMAASGVVTEGEKIQIKGWFKDLPFHRIVDIKLSFVSGAPDFVGLCIQGNPSQYLSVDACASAFIFMTALSAHVTSRFLQYNNIKGHVNADGSISYWGNTFAVGPSVGVREITSVSIFGGGGSTGYGVDTLISAEWVHWFSRYFGLGLTLDAGAIFMVSQSQAGYLNPVLPMVRLSLGLSF